MTYTPKANGNVTSIPNPAGNMRSFTYDAQGNLIAITDPEQNLKPEAERLKTQIAYNQFGQPVSTTDPLGSTTTFTYDNVGNLAAIADPLGNTTSRTYDLVSRLIAQTDPRGKTTRFAYDQLNRITQIVDALNGVSTLSYDANGNLLTVTDPRGNTWTHTYDSMDRLVARTDPLGQTETMEYNQIGNLVSAIDRKGQTTTFSYDQLDRQVSVTYSDGSTTQYVYDAGGRRVQILDSLGGTIHNEYDNLNRLMTEITAQGAVRYQYDALGRRTNMTVDGQAPVTYAYDANSQLRGITQSPLNPVTIDYDALGRRSLLTLPNEVSTEYRYDAAGRFIALIYRNAAGLIGNLTYQYDAASNRISTGGSLARTLLPDPVPSATYDSANRQLTFGAKTMAFDANGNLTSITDASGTLTLTWDARDQLSSLTSPTISAAFEYDAIGRRTLRTANGQSRTFQYDGRNVVREGTPAGEVFYLGGLDLDEVWVRQDDGAADTIITDTLGSPIAFLNLQGTVSAELTYEPFGRATRSGVATENPLAFTGREDDGTGLLYYRARYYHPGLSRYISEDPLAFRDGLNAYTYVRNQPTVARDPLGLLTVIVHGLRFGKPKEGAYKDSPFAQAIHDATGETVKEVLWSGNLLSGKATSDAFRQIAELAQEAANRGEPLNIIGHSWGSVLAANYLAVTGTPADLLVTMGSPLSAGAADPSSAAVWVNIASGADPISWGSVTTGAEQVIRFGVGHTGYWADPVTRSEIIKRILEQQKERKR